MDRLFGRRVCASATVAARTLSGRQAPSAARVPPGSAAASGGVESVPHITVPMSRKLMTVVEIEIVVVDAVGAVTPPQQPPNAQFSGSRGVQLAARAAADVTAVDRRRGTTFATLAPRYPANNCARITGDDHGLTS